MRVTYVQENGPLLFPHHKIGVCYQKSITPILWISATMNDHNETLFSYQKVLCNFHAALPLNPWANKSPYSAACGAISPLAHGPPWSLPTPAHLWSQMAQHTLKALTAKHSQLNDALLWNKMWNCLYIHVYIYIDIYIDIYRYRYMWPAPPKMRWKSVLGESEVWLKSHSARYSDEIGAKIIALLPKLTEICLLKGCNPRKCISEKLAIKR